MPRIIATCWDDHRWLVAVAQSRGKSFTIERWLDGSSSGNGAGISAALAEARLTNEPCWVAVGRGRVELRPQKFPPIPAEELPALIRMQAMQQATSDRLLCDYLPLQVDERGTEVLVATAGGELSDAVNKAVAPASVQRLALRPLCSAAWLAQISTDQPMPTMLIDPRPTEVDYVIFRDRLPAFVRTVRLPEDPIGAAEVLATEARRSLITGGMSDALGGAAPRIAVWGDTKAAEHYLPSLQRTLGNQVRFVHPALGQTHIGSPPSSADPSAIAALLGLLSAGLAAPEQLIDLVQPRKPPDPPNLKQRYAIIGGSIAAAVALIGWLGYSQINGYRVEAAELLKESNSLTKLVDQANVQKNNLAQVEKFTSGNVHWLEQLAMFSEVAPGADQMMIKSLTGQSTQAAPGKASVAGGKLIVTGTVTKTELLDDLDLRLREKKVSVERGKVNEETGRQQGYRWAFTETVQVPAWVPPASPPVAAKSEKTESEPETSDSSNNSPSKEESL